MAASSSLSRTFTAAHIRNFQVQQPERAQHLLAQVRRTSAGPHLHPDLSKQLSKHSLSVLTAKSESEYDLREAVEGDSILPFFVLGNPVDDQCDRTYVASGESAVTGLTFRQLCKFVWDSRIGSVLVWDLSPYVTVPFGLVEVIRPAAAAADLEAQDPRRQLLIQRIGHLCELAPTRVILFGQYVQWAFSRFIQWTQSLTPGVATTALRAAPNTVTTFDWHVRSLKRVIHFAHCPHPSAWHFDGGRLMQNADRVSLRGQAEGREERKRADEHTQVTPDHSCAHSAHAYTRTSLPHR